MNSLERDLPDNDAPILIVDDDRAAAAALRRILERAHYTRVVSTSDPLGVVELLGQHRPHLLVLDLLMPGVDGFEIMRRLPELFRADDLPEILVVTGADDRVNRLKALQAGARDYLVKPYDPEEVRLRAHNLLDIRAKRRLLSSVLDATPVAMIAQDDAGRCTYINRSALDLLGYADAETLIGQAIHQITHHHHPDGSAYLESECPIAALRRSGRPVHDDDEVFWRADGSALPVEYWAYPLSDVGQSDGVLLTFMDISARRESERHLRLASTVFESVDRALVITDAQGDIVAVNPAYSQLTGWGREEVIGRNPRFRKSGRHDADFYAGMWQALLTHGRWEGELWNLRKDGVGYLEEATITSVRDGRGNITNFVAALRDLTEERHRSQELESARLRADAASRAKSRFVANMSHEIRTPLTAILGFAETLLDDSRSAAERTEAVETIIRSGRFLQELIEDILDFSKIEAERLEVERIQVPLADLLSAVASVAAARARVKGLGFELIVEPPWPRTLTTDPTRLEQILVNLLSNAAKFTAHGVVRLRVSLDRARELLICSVEDSGPGIEPERLPGLFEPFVQADASTARHHGGSGLGLTISRALARLLGGDLTATSTPGLGSRFTASLATGQLPDGLLEWGRLEVDQGSLAVLPRDEPTVRLAGDILLAEDNPDNRRLVTYYLERVGARVRTAQNGVEAVELAQQEEFDLVLMDMQMPEMDGLDATRLLRLSGFVSPIVALTANATETDRRDALWAGCTDFLCKPIQRRDFYAVIGRYLKAADHQHPAPAKTPLRDLQGYQELCAAFEEHLPLDLAAMRQAWTQHDRARLAALAHQMKGVAGSFGRPEATRVAGAIETHVRQGDDAGVAELLAELEEICRARSS